MAWSSFALGADMPLSVAGRRAEPGERIALFSHNRHSRVTLSWLRFMSGLVPPGGRGVDRGLAGRRGPEMKPRIPSAAGENRPDEAGRGRVADPDSRHARAGGVRDRDGLFGHVRCGRGRRGEPELLPRAAGHLRGARNRAARDRAALGLSPPARARARPRPRLALPARRSTRRRADRERSAALDLGRAGRLPAVRVREARARDLGGRVPLEPPRAAHAGGARPAVRRARRGSSPSC